MTAAETAAYDAYGDDSSTQGTRGTNRNGRGGAGRRGTNRTRQPRMWVKVDEFGELVPLTEDETVKLRERAQNLCLWHLGQGPRTRHQLMTAMTKHGVPEGMATEVVDRLADYNYVNDVDYAANYVRSRVATQRKGTLVVRQELRRKGVDDATVAEALAAVDPADEATNARLLVDRKLASTRGLDHAKRVQRLVGMLARKGYPAGMAYTVIREAINDEAVMDEIPDHLLGDDLT